MASNVGQEGDDDDPIPGAPPIPFNFRASLIQQLVATGRYLSISGGNTIDLSPVVAATGVAVGGAPIFAHDMFGDRHTVSP